MYLRCVVIELGINIKLLLAVGLLWYLKLSKTVNFVFKLLPILGSLHEYGKLIII